MSFQQSIYIEQKHDFQKSSIVAVSFICGEYHSPSTCH